MSKITRGIGEKAIQFGRKFGPIEAWADAQEEQAQAQQRQLDALTAAAVTPPTPAEPSIPVMPLRDDAAAVTAKKKSVATQRTRKGRRSTILTALDDNEGVLGA